MGRIFKTTAFKLSLIFLLIFTLFAASLIGYFAYSTQRLMGRQINETVRAEIVALSEQFRQGGMRRLVSAVERRSRRPSASLYLVVNPRGQFVAGNVAELSEGVLKYEGRVPHPVRYKRFDQEIDDRRSEPPPHRAVLHVFRLPGGFQLLVGRDIGERERLGRIIGSALIWSIALLIVLALLSWAFVTRRVLKKIDTFGDASRQIMVGDLSGRIPEDGSGDEFDRLARSLNAMLDRIEALMRGLKEVSDNIAHDLKTPLARMRNRAESALAGPEDLANYRDNLEKTIEEADALIGTFNALLLIARVEAGSSNTEFKTVDGAEILDDVIELYQPLAEELQVSLAGSQRPDGDFTVKGSRELIAQALSNLIDNALKYAPSGDQAGTAEIRADIHQTPAEIVFTVADNGPGIPDADKVRVMERFVRLEESRTRPGNGLGLSLVGAVAKLHGGTLELADGDPGLICRLRVPRQV